MHPIIKAWLMLDTAKHWASRSNPARVQVMLNRAVNRYEQWLNELLEAT